MATSIDFSKYELNRLMIDNLTQDILLRPAYNMLKVLKTSDPEKTYITSITKIKAARYEIVGIEDMTPTLWSTIKHAYDKDKILGVKSVSVKKLHGYSHLKEIVVKGADRQLYKFKEGDFVDLHLNDIEDISLVIKKCVEDLQLGVESYQKKLNITAPQKTFPEIDLKLLYTLSYKPPGDELHHIILDFHLGYNDEMLRRKWTAIDKKRSELMVELIDKQMRERRIIRNLERLVGARELEMDYKLMTHTV
ncbi:hypothetical protein Tco_0589945 [Tanacetum coccineum]